MHLLGPSTYVSAMANYKGTCTHTPMHFVFFYLFFFFCFFFCFFFFLFRLFLEKSGEREGN